MEVIRRFLEDVVQVVPLESIAYAIAHGKPDEIAIQCAEALMSAQLYLPFSLLMTNGLAKAVRRFQSGVSPEVLTDMQIKAQEQSTGMLPWCSVTKDSKQLTVTMLNEERAATSATSLDWEKLEEEYGEVPAQDVVPGEVVAYILKAQKESTSQWIAAMNQGNPVNIICGLSVEQLYPITTDPTQQLSALKSPLDILRAGKRKLDSLAREAQEIVPAKRHLSSDSQHLKEKGVLSWCNALMLKSVNKI